MKLLIPTYHFWNKSITKFLSESEIYTSHNSRLVLFQDITLNKMKRSFIYIMNRFRTLCELVSYFFLFIGEQYFKLAFIAKHFVFSQQISKENKSQGDDVKKLCNLLKNAFQDFFQKIDENMNQTQDYPEPWDFQDASNTTERSGDPLDNIKKHFSRYVKVVIFN